MILIKEFFRRRITKIYLILLTIIIITITLLLNFSNYYKNIVNDVYLENSRILIKSPYDIKDKLDSNEKIINIEQVALADKEETGDIKDYLLYDSISQSIILTENKNEQDNDNIAINLINYHYKNIENIEEYLNKKVILKNDNYQKKYNIKEVKESKFTNISLSKEELTKFIESNKLYTYIFTVTNYEEIDDIISNLTEDNKIECLRLEYLENNSEVETVEALESLIPLLYTASKILMIAFTIILLIIIHNIISSEMDNMRIEWIIGFQRHHFFLILLSKIISLLLLTIILSTILYLLINYLIIRVLNINIYLFSKEILYLIPITLLLTITYITIFVIRNNYYIKSK